MAINKETTFVDATTVVTAAWLNLIQQHLAGLATIVIDTPTSTQVRILAGSDDAVAAVYIGGQQRYRDTNVSFTFTTEPSATYNVYVTAPAGVNTFNLEVTTGVPGTSPYRKIAEVDWSGSAITAYRMEDGRLLAHDHSALDGTGTIAHSQLSGLTTGDPHTQYMKPDGSRAFTGKVSGVVPTADLELVTKGYIDGLAAPGLPIGTILPYAGADSQVPAGWFLCDGASKDTTAEADLFAIIGYTYGGAGANFTLPDLEDRFALGKAASGTGSTLGSTGGAKGHTHTQATHTHNESAHTHTTASHSHSTPTSGAPSVSHTHTQGATGSDGDHYHKGEAHTHTGAAITIAATGAAIVGTAYADQGTAGLYSESDLDNGASGGASHSHSGSTYTASGWDGVAGNTASATPSHTHAPSGNAYGHTHTSGQISGGTFGSEGRTNTSSEPAHTHTNPDFAADATADAHTHAGVTTGTASPTTASGGGGATSAAGDDATGAGDPPFLRTHYIIRAS